MWWLWSIHSGRTTSRYLSSGASITPRSPRAGRAGAETSARTSERHLRHQPDRLELAAHAERRHAGGLPLRQAFADALARPTERHLVDQRVGHRGFRFGLAAGQVEVLDLRGGFFVAVAAHDLVVEIAPARAH